MPPLMFSKEEDKAIIDAYQKQKYPIQWLLKNVFHNKFTKRQIGHRASYLNITRPRKQAPVFTEEDNNMIIAAYNKRENPIAFLMNNSHIGAKYPKDSIKKQASILGVNRIKAKLSEREKEIITKRIGECSLVEIEKALRNAGFKRTQSTIRAFIYRSGRSTVKGDRYSETDIKMFFKCHNLKVVEWRKKGLLVPIAKSEGDHHHYYYYRPIDIAKFIRYHPFELEGYYVDIPWLVSLFEEFWNRMNRSKEDE